MKGGKSIIKETRDGDLNEFTSSWSWLNKDRILLDFGCEEFEVDQLKSKELILTVNETDKDTFVNGDTDENVNTYTYTFTKK